MDADALPTLLIDLARRRFSGVLELANDTVTKEIAWADGLPALAESSRPRESLAARLAERGELGAADCARVQEQRARGGRELACLVALRRVAPSALLRAVREHLESCLVEVFAWPTLRSRLRDGTEDLAAQGVDPLPIVQAGVARYWTIERMLASLGLRASLRVRARPEARSLLGRLRGGALEQLLTTLDGRRTLAASLAAASSPESMAALWLLDAAGALDALEEVTPPAEVAATPRIEIVVAGRDGPAPEADASETRADPGEGARDTAAELRAEVERLHGALDEQSHYALLELEPDASIADVRRAYRQAAKRLHPDALARLGLDDLKEKANELFSAISLAHATLGDPLRRREYDASQDSGAEAADADRLARAEMLYRKAQVLLRAGRFVDALPLLEAAASLWPEEAVYHADLGWALYKIPKPRLPEARHALERAIELDPRAAAAHDRLGLVLAALGEHEQAARLRDRARALGAGRRA